MPQLEIQLLGPLQVNLGGEPATGFNFDKVRALLAYLAVESGRPVRREKLAGLLWPEFTERSARTNLRQALTNLRRVLGDQEADPPFLLPTRQTIRFNEKSDYSLDVRAFTSLSVKEPGRAPDVGELEEAIALYQGSFMAGFSLPDSPAFEEWILINRESFQRQALNALHRLAGYYQEKEAFEHALPLAYRQVEIDAYQEAAHQQVMQLLAQSGQRNKALSHYEEYRQLLETDLGVTPLEQTQAMYEELQAGNLPGPAAATVLLRREPREVGASPYRGLAAFREEDAPFFFGREAFTDRLTKAVRSRSLMSVIVGPSGSGKSSTVFSGLLPRLRTQKDWLIVHCRPRSQPFQTLAAALIPVLEPNLSRTDQLVEAAKLAEALEDGSASLFDVILGSLETDNADRCLLVVDQFEELYTLCPEPDDRNQFLDTLLESTETGAAQRRSPFVLVLTLRADFVSQALAHRPFADALQESALLLGPMNRVELRTAIEKPADKQGAAFEAGLIGRILDDVGEEPGNLPLLEFALTLLWERIDQGWLTHQAYEDIGRVQGALARHAEQVYDDLRPPDQAQARRVLIQLVQPGEGTEDTRRVAARSEFGDEQWALVQYLADRRLVVTGSDESGEETAEVVHEALIRGWGRLQEWMAADRDFRVWQENLRVALRGWENSKRDQGALLRGAPLAQAEEWLGRRADEIGQEERRYIQASLNLRERQIQERDRRRRLIVGGLGIGMVVAVLLSVFAFSQRQSAIATAAEAQIVALVSGSQAAFASQDSDTALALAWQAVTLNPDSAIAQAQLSKVAYAPGTVRILSGNEDIVNRVVLSPDDKTLLGGVDDGSVIVWEIATGQILWQQQVQTKEEPDWVQDWVQDVAYSPDGQYVAATYDDRIMFWRAADGQLFRQIDSLVNRQKIVFNPTGDQYATIGSEEPGRLVVWDFESGDVLGEYEHGSNVEDLVYTADGSAILIAGKAGTLILIDARTGGVLQEFQEYSGSTPAALRNIALSPDGTRVIASAAAAGLLVWDFETGELRENYSYEGVFAAEAHPQDGSVLIGDFPLLRTIDLATGAILRTNIGHDRGILSVAISADGSRAYTASADESIRVWDLHSGQMVRRFAEPQLQVSEISLSPDGTMVLAGSRDGTIRLWDVEKGEEIHRSVIDQPVNSVAFSPDGKKALIGAGYEDVQEIESGHVILWDVGAGAEIRRFEGYPYAVSAVAFSPDGRIAASAGHGALAILWDVETGAEIRRFEDYWVDSPWGIESYTDVAFSPDGAQVLATHDDGNIISWDVKSGQEIRELAGHQTGAMGLSFSNDGLQLASGGMDSQVILWDTQTGNLQRRLDQAGGMARPHFSPDGAFLLGGSLTGVTSLLQVETGEVIRSYDGFAQSLNFSSDGKQAVIGLRSGGVELWRIDSTLDELFTWTKNNRYIPELTCEQREYYNIEPPCDPEP